HIDLGTGDVMVLNAGRRTPTLVRSGRTVRELGGGGQALGFSSETSVQVARMALGPGDCVVLCADGMVETYGPDGSVLRAAELKKLLVAGTAPAEMRDDIAARARSVWKGMTDQHAVLVFKWKPILG